MLIAAALLLVFRNEARPLFDEPAVRSWSTVFVAVGIQALPFLVLGVTISGVVAAFVSPRAIARVLPRTPLVAVPTAVAAGAFLPGCECSSVPIAGRLVNRGAPASAALAFLLSAPAINPVVLVATATAFPGQPEMVFARLGASALAATIVGWVWARFGDDRWIERARAAEHHHSGSKLQTLVSTAQHDFAHAGGFLIVGAATAATLQTVVPRSVLDAVAAHGLGAILALGVLAVALAVCSEADAFVAAGLSQFSLTARLAFLVVGPMVDVKLIALQVGTFGRSFALRFAPLTFVTAITSAALVGWIAFR